jgi:hypothetical protein
LHFPHLQSFNILQSLLVSARLRPARASSEGLGWLAGWICDLASPLGVSAPAGVALYFLTHEQKSPDHVGALSFLAGNKKPDSMAGLSEQVAVGKILNVEK